MAIIAVDDRESDPGSTRSDQRNLSCASGLPAGDAADRAVAGVRGRVTDRLAEGLTAMMRSPLLAVRAVASSALPPLDERFQGYLGVSPAHLLAGSAPGRHSRGRHDRGPRDRGSRVRSDARVGAGAAAAALADPGKILGYNSQAAITADHLKRGRPVVVDTAAVCDWASG